MQEPTLETHPIRTQSDIVTVRLRVKALAAKLGMGLVDQTKVVTAASELARNTLDYGGGGEAIIETLLKDPKTPGIRLVFADQGPGIADVELALTDGFTSGKGLGLGLSGSKRLMSDFHIETAVGKGTRVTVTKWK